MTKKVLVYDDDTDILEICRYILEKMGLEVFTEQSCKTVIEDMENYSPDVVVMDNWIPDIGGIEATKMIKKDPRFKKIPVILFTASRNIEKFAEEAKADAFLEKPFDIKKMEEVVEKALKGA